MPRAPRSSCAPSGVTCGESPRSAKLTARSGWTFSEAVGPVLAATVQNPVALSRLIQTLSPLPRAGIQRCRHRHHGPFRGQTGATPLSYCHVTADEETHELTGIEVLEDAWVVTPKPIPFRSLFLSPSGDPNHGRPRYLRVIYGKQENRYLLSDMQNVLICLRATLNAWTRT